MTDSVTHATFVLERTYDVSPERVFAAWARSRPRSAGSSAPTSGSARTTSWTSASVAGST